MNRIRRTAAAVLGIAALAACADQTPLQPTPPPAGPAVEGLLAMGFARGDIVDAGDRYVVEGDIVFRKADLEGGARFQSLPAPGARGQYTVVNAITKTKMAQGITVNLSSISSSTGWRDAARAAMQAWNATYGNMVYFTEVTSGADVNITFGIPSPTSSSAVVETTFPVNGAPVSPMTINQTFATGGYYNATQMKLILVHELGHLIGLRHTNWRSGGDAVGADTVWVPGTPTGGEAASVMTKGNAGQSYNGFTSNDLKAASFLYPSTAPVFTSATYDAGSHPLVSWSTSPYASSYRVNEQLMVPYWQDDPFYQPDGGYWTHVWAAGPIGTTTSTSYSVTGRTRTYDDSCGLFFYVEPVYPSGKAGTPSNGSPTFDAC